MEDLWSSFSFLSNKKTADGFRGGDCFCNRRPHLRPTRPTPNGTGRPHQRAPRGGAPAQYASCAGRGPRSACRYTRAQWSAGLRSLSRTSLPSWQRFSVRRQPCCRRVSQKTLPRENSPLFDPRCPASGAFRRHRTPRGRGGPRRVRKLQCTS